MEAILVNVARDHRFIQTPHDGSIDDVESDSLHCELALRKVA